MTEKKHQITGLGPVQADGSVDLFTVAKNPFMVTAEWLASQPGYPKVGDWLKEDAEGNLSLVFEAPATAPAAQGTEKKTDGDGSETGGEAETPLTANYVDADGNEVTAYEVTAVRDVNHIELQANPELENYVHLTLDNGQVQFALKEAKVQVGDFWVVETDGTGVQCYYMPLEAFSDEFLPKATQATDQQAQ